MVKVDVVSTEGVSAPAAVSRLVGSVVLGASSQTARAIEWATGGMVLRFDRKKLEFYRNALTFALPG